MPKYRWQYKAIGEENQGMIPLNAAYYFVRGTIDTTLKNFTGPNAPEDNTEVMGQNYGTSWKITYPLRYLKKKLFGWGKTTIATKAANVAKDYIRGDWYYYNGEYIANQFEYAKSGVCIDKDKIKSLFEQTGYKLDYDEIFKDIKKELCGDENEKVNVAFYAPDWRTKVIPGMLQSIYEKQAKLMSDEVVRRFSEQGISHEKLESVLKAGLEKLGEAIENLSQQLADKTDILDMPLRMKEKEIPDKDIPKEFTEEQKQKLKSMKFRTLMDIDVLQKDINKRVKEYEVLYNNSYEKGDEKFREKLRTAGDLKIEPYKEKGYIEATGDTISTTTTYVESLMGGMKNVVANTLRATGNAIWEVGGVIGANLVGGSESIGNYLLDKNIKTWENKVLGTYYHGYGNVSTGNYITGRIDQTLQDWKDKHPENTYVKTSVFGRDYGEKHLWITAPFRYLGKKLFGWGLNKGADFAAGYAKDYIKGEWYYAKGPDVLKVISPGLNTYLDLDQNLMIDLYNISGYEMSADKISARLAEALDESKSIGFYGTEWRQKVVPGMIKSMYEEFRKEMFEQITRKFAETPLLMSRTLLEKTLREANKKLGAVFEDYSMKLAEKTDFLDIPPRLIADKDKDEKELSPNLTKEQKANMLLKGRRPGLTSDKLIAKAVKGYVKKIKDNPLADKEMPENEIHDRLGIVPREHVVPPKTMSETVTEAVVEGAKVLANAAVETTKVLANAAVETTKAVVNTVVNSTTYVAKMGADAIKKVAETSYNIAKGTVNTVYSGGQMIYNGGAVIINGTARAINGFWTTMKSITGYGDTTYREDPEKKEGDLEAVEEKPTEEIKEDVEEEPESIEESAEIEIKGNETTSVDDKVNEKTDGKNDNQIEENTEEKIVDQVEENPGEKIIDQAEENISEKSEDEVKEKEAEVEKKEDIKEPEAETKINNVMNDEHVKEVGSSVMSTVVNASYNVVTGTYNIARGTINTVYNGGAMMYNVGTKIVGGLLSLGKWATGYGSTEKTEEKPEKVEEAKTEEVKEVLEEEKEPEKVEEVKVEEAKTEEVKEVVEEEKKPEKVEEVKTEEIKAEEVKEVVEEEKEPEKVEEVKTEETKTEEVKVEEAKPNEIPQDDDDEYEECYDPEEEKRKELKQVGSASETEDNIDDYVEADMEEDDDDEFEEAEETNEKKQEEPKVEEVTTAKVPETRDGFEAVEEGEVAEEKKEDEPEAEEDKDELNMSFEEPQVKSTNSIFYDYTVGLFAKTPKTPLERIDDKIKEVGVHLKGLEEKMGSGKEFKIEATKDIAKMTTLLDAKAVCIAHNGKDIKPQSLDQLLSDSYLNNGAVKKCMKNPYFVENIKSMTDEELVALSDFKEMAEFHKDSVAYKIKLNQERKLKEEAALKEAEQLTEGPKSEEYKKRGGLLGLLGY